MIMEEQFINADCVHFDKEYTEFILNHEVIARILNCIFWEKVIETK